MSEGGDLSDLSDLNDVSDVSTEAAGPEHEAGLMALFEAAASPCYCRFWHFEGTNNAWLEKCALAPNENREELEQALRSGSAEAKGVVAVTRSEAGAAAVIGWLKVAPVEVMKKAYERRLYKNLPCFAGDRAGVFAIGCALVHPAHRHKGVAARLVEGAVRLAPGWGIRALEAFPRRPKEPVSDEELWTGPVSVFAKNGFVEVNVFEPYPVLRRDLF
jgi:GNAT superfamily N-acetyltransferase